jgi:hypothetical protein
MTRIFVLCLALAGPLSWADAQEGQVKNSTRPVAKLAEQYCAAFTSHGESLTVTLVGANLSLEITPLSKPAITLLLPINQADDRETLLVGALTCGVSISASNRRAAIGIREAVEQEGKKRDGIFIVLVNLETNQFENQYFVESHEISGSLPGLVGFLGDSESLVVVNYTPFYSPANLAIATIDTSTGEVKRITPDLSRFTPVRRVFFDSRDSLVWVELDPPSNNSRKSKLPTLQSIFLAGEQKPGPKIDLANLHHEHAVPKWLAPSAIAFPTPTSVVYAETEWSLGFGPSHLWVADLASDSLRGMDLPKDIGAALLHGLGLTWLEDVGGPAVLSPDGRFVVIPIELTTTGSPYIVDNYVHKGSRLVIVDLQHLRILSSISPERDRQPVGFALDHRDGKVTLLVNWHEGWKRLQFADSK